MGEGEALESVGLSTSKWADDASRDPLMRSIADYMALLETSLSAAEAARYLKVDVSRIRQRLRERSLYGIEYNGERRLPRLPKPVSRKHFNILGGLTGHFRRRGWWSLKQLLHCWCWI
jgi:hypothetical protein